MKSKWAKLTVKRLKSGTVSEGVLRKMRSVLRDAINAEQYFNREPSPSATAGEALRIVELVRQTGPAVTSAQARKGAEWLWRMAYTSAGKVRNTEDARQFTELDLRVLAECRESPVFRLVGLELHYSGRYLDAIAPVYRCVGLRSGSFDYVAQSWQSGGGFAILRHA